MDDDASQRYSDARVEHAKTVGDYYENIRENPAVFVAGVQYALDKIVSQSERYYGLIFPNYAQMGPMVSVRTITEMATDILDKAKRGEPQ